MPSKITLNNKEKKEIAINVMKKLQQILESNFEGNETLSFQIPQLNTDTTIRPKIIITTTAGLKMNELVRNCSKEVGWHGFVERVDETTFKITDIVVYPQTVTGTNVTVDELEYAKWLMHLSTEQVKQMRFQGHSHVNMTCSPSPVDTELYNKYLANLTEDDFYIFFICNKRGDITAFVYDLKTNTKYNTSDIDIIKETDMSAWWDSVKDTITEYKPKTLQSGSIFKSGIGDDMHNADVQERQSYFHYDAYDQFPDSWPARITREKNKTKKGAKK